MEQFENSKVHEKIAGVLHRLAREHCQDNSYQSEEYMLDQKDWDAFKGRLEILNVAQLQTNITGETSHTHSPGSVPTNADPRALGDKHQQGQMRDRSQVNSKVHFAKTEAKVFQCMVTIPRSYSIRILPGASVKVWTIAGGGTGTVAGGVAGGGVGAGIGAGIGAAVGTVAFPGVGTLVGAGVGALIGIIPGAVVGGTGVGVGGGIGGKAVGEYVRFKRSFKVTAEQILSDFHDFSVDGENVYASMVIG
jgi:hypothetical protein